MAKVQEVFNHRYAQLCQSKGSIQSQLDKLDEQREVLKRNLEDVNRKIKVLDAEIPTLTQLESAIDQHEALAAKNQSIKEVTNEK